MFTLSSQQLVNPPPNCYHLGGYLSLVKMVWTELRRGVRNPANFIWQSKSINSTLDKCVLKKLWEVNGATKAMSTYRHVKPRSCYSRELLATV